MQTSTSLPPTAPQRRGWSIKLTIASVVVMAMASLAVCIISLGWVGARQSLVDAAARSARDAGLLITEKSHRMLEPAQATLRLLSSTALVDAKTTEERLRSIAILSDVLVANSLVSAVYVGYTDGAFFLIRPLDLPAMREQFRAPPKANFMVQSVAIVSGKPKGEYLFFDASKHLLERRSEPGYQFDPRTRPWFNSAQNSVDPVFAEPYVFFTTRQIGITLSQSSADGKAIFGIDVVLDDLAASLTELRTSRNAQLALVNAQGQVLAYPDMSQVLVQSAGRFEFKPLKDLGVPSLAALHNLNPQEGKVLPYDVDGVEWLGVALPFNVWSAQGMHLLLTAPSDDLLGDLKARALRLVEWIVGIALLLMPLGWAAGASIGRSLDRLSEQAKRMSQFDFHRTQRRASFVREVNNLSAVMADMGQTIETFLDISHNMAHEPKVESMLSQVLHQMIAATRCVGGAVYLSQGTDGAMQQAASDGTLIARESQQIHYTPKPTTASARTEVAPGVTELQVELLSRSGRVEGLLVLQYLSDEGHAEASFIEFVTKLSGMLAVSIETRQLIDAQKALLDAVIKLMADAIDAKSPYTGGHCERVPLLAAMLVDRMAAETTGPYAAFTMSDDERYEFHLGAWLHDCGKVTSPEHIIDKATKLETIYNRIHEVRMRFEVLLRDAHLAFWQGVAAGGDRAALEAVRDAQCAQLQDDFAFVARCNVGGEFMAEADSARLAALAQTPWTRHFDNRLGLSTQELMRINSASPQARPLPAQEPLLADRPDHIVPWGVRRPPVEKGDPNNLYGFDMPLPPNEQHLGELYNLSVRRGTLTDEDRFKINDHIVQTLVMLRRLPWPAQLARVPDIAATHHEKLDGKGYPRKLVAHQLTVADRVMALADIFEALTAADRPYKAPKTLMESLRIMAFMAKDQHLDTDLFRYFLYSGLWRDFADRYMNKSQIDAVDLAALEKILPAVAQAA
jgi:HD-GYP domain-containing protein (c-di-GMP phosphodiesterase class II)